MKAARLVVLLLAALAATACGSPRKSEPIATPIALDEEQQRGRDLFDQFCHKCHPRGEGGLGPALNDKPLPQFLLRYQIRHGLGTMPAFPEERLSDEDLDRLVKYLVRIRKA